MDKKSTAATVLLVATLIVRGVQLADEIKRLWPRR